MAIIPHGNSGTIVEVEANTRAVRVVRRPPNHGNLGAYCTEINAATSAGAITGDFFHFRWTSSHSLCRIVSFVLHPILITAPTVSDQIGSFTVFFSKNWTADGSGGTAHTLTGNNNHLRTGMGTSLVGTVRQSTGLALGAGAKDNDAQPLFSFSFVALIADPVPKDFKRFRAPITSCPVLAQNEGLTFRFVNTGGSTTYNFGGFIKWQELSAYEYGLPRK